MQGPADLSLASGALRAVVAPGLGGRIASLRVDGGEVLVVDGPGPLEQGWFPMAPFAGRLREGRFTFEAAEHHVPLTSWPNAIHGTVHSVPWAVEEQDGSSCTLVAELGVAWPWRGTVRHRIELVDRTVRVALEIATEEAGFPASCGWHPWFRRSLDHGGPAEIDLDAGAMWERGEDDLPTGRLVPPRAGPWDDCFTELGSPPLIRWPGALVLEVQSSCEHVVVFDERPEGVCIEPQTGPPDAPNLRPEVVAPGAPLVADATFTFRPDPSA